MLETFRGYFFITRILDVSLEWKVILKMYDLLRESGTLHNARGDINHVWTGFHVWKLPREYIGLLWGISLHILSCYGTFPLTWLAALQIYWSKRESGSTPSRLVWDTNMAAVSVFWGIDVKTANRMVVLFSFLQEIVS